LGLLRIHPILLADGPTPTNQKFVWRDSIYSCGRLSRSQIEFSANVGIFASNRSAFTMDAIETAATSGLEIVEHMDLLSSEQPFLNFLFVTSNLPYTSLRSLQGGRYFSRIPIVWWGGSNGGIVVGGQLYVVAHRGRFLLGRCPIMAVHWAGQRTKQRIDSNLWIDLYRQNSADTGRGAGTWFRYRKLWEHYANALDPRSPRLRVSDLDG
jgi:hypothetical protein